MARISAVLCALRVAMSSAVIEWIILREAGRLASRNAAIVPFQWKPQSCQSYRLRDPRALLNGRRTPITGRRLQDSLCIFAVRRLTSRLPPEGAGGKHHQTWTGKLLPRL